MNRNDEDEDKDEDEDACRYSHAGASACLLSRPTVVAGEESVPWPLEGRRSQVGFRLLVFHLLQ